MNSHSRRIPRRPRAVGLPFAAALLFTVAAFGQEAPKTKLPLTGLGLQDLDGYNVELASYVGKGPLILDFWATWCKPCLAALPELQRLYADLAPRGVQLVGINEDGARSASTIKPFAKTHAIAFPILLDLNRAAQSRLQVLVLPTTLLIDTHGTVVRTSFGYQPGDIEALRKAAEALLDKPPKQ